MVAHSANIFVLSALQLRIYPNLLEHHLYFSVLLDLYLVHDIIHQVVLLFLKPSVWGQVESFSSVEQQTRKVLLLSWQTARVDETIRLLAPRLLELNMYVYYIYIYIYIIYMYV